MQAAHALLTWSLWYVRTGTNLQRLTMPEWRAQHVMLGHFCRMKQVLCAREKCVR